MYESGVASHSAKRPIHVNFILDDVIRSREMEKTWKTEAVGKNDISHTSPQLQIRKVVSTEPVPVS